MISGFLSSYPKLRALCTRCGSLLLMFQRAPLIKMLFPEARGLAGAGLGELTKWTVATFAGLGAYDTVAGATTISQVIPASGSTTVNTAVGSSLTFVYQLTGSPFNGNAGSWVTSALPAGLTHTALAAKTTDSITGIPSTAGNTEVQVTVRDAVQPNLFNASKSFTLVVGPRIITTQPAASTSIASGATAVLSVTAATGNGSALAYQWYEGTSPSITTPVSGATSASFTTPVLTADKNYWVKVTRTVSSTPVVANSTTAAVKIAVPAPPSITTQPASTTIDSNATTTLTVAASGTGNTLQWYLGSAGDTTNAIATATSASFTTPALTATTLYWVRVTNADGHADSATAVVTVNDPFTTWQSAVFTPEQRADSQISGPDADPDGDGIRNSDEYLFGTLPLAKDGQLLTITSSGGQVTLSFDAKQASGAGYAGKTRHYALETRTDFATGDWATVAGQQDVVGANQPATFSTAISSGARAFYHLRVWLTP